MWWGISLLSKYLGCFRRILPISADSARILGVQKFEGYRSPCSPPPLLSSSTPASYTLVAHWCHCFTCDSDCWTIFPTQLHVSQNMVIPAVCLYHQHLYYACAVPSYKANAKVQAPSVKHLYRLCSCIKVAVTLIWDFCFDNLFGHWSSYLITLLLWKKYSLCITQQLSQSCYRLINFTSQKEI